MTNLVEGVARHGEDPVLEIEVGEGWLGILPAHGEEWATAGGRARCREEEEDAES